MTYTYWMTTHCRLAGRCARYEDDVGKCLLTRNYADFSEALIRGPDTTTSCPFFIDKNDVRQTAH